MCGLTSHQVCGAMLPNRGYSCVLLLFRMTLLDFFLFLIVHGNCDAKFRYAYSQKFLNCLFVYDGDNVLCGVIFGSISVDVPLLLIVLFKWLV